MANPCRGKGGLDTDKVEREITIGAQFIRAGAKDYKSYSDAMAKTFGEGVRPYTTELFIRSKALNEAVKLPAKLLAKEKNLNRRTEVYEQKIENRDFAREIREALPEPREIFEARQKFDATRKQWNRMVEEKAMRDRPAWQRYLDKAVALSRWSKLTGLETMVKIAGAVTTRIPQAMVEATFNEAMRQVPGVGRLFKEAGVEGAGVAELPSYVRGIKRGIKEIPGVMKGTIETYENRGPSPFQNKVANVLDMTSVRLHASGKNPAKMASYEHAKEYLTKEAQRMGKDLSDPSVLADIEEGAKAEGNRSIFLRDNFVSSGFNSFVHVMEKSKKFPTSGFITAKAARFLLPIIRVPTNIAGEALSMSGGGLISAAVKSMKIMQVGMDGLSTVQKASIVRSLKKGSLGIALFMIGYWNKDKLGGLYDPKNNDGKNLKDGTAKIGGITIPKLLMHSPPMLVMQAGAHTAKLMEDRGKSLPEAYGNAQLQLMHEVPFIRELSTLDSLFATGHSTTFAKELGRQVQGLIPQAIQNIAKWTDEHPESIWEPVKRKPTTFGEQIKMGIPGLRQTVPKREEKVHLPTRR